jgi:hypothetical protein
MPSRRWLLSNGAPACRRNRVKGRQCQPPMQLLHYRGATTLMKVQALFRPQTTRIGIVALHLAQHLQYTAAFVWKVSPLLPRLSSPARAVRQQNLHPRGQPRNIAREWVTHLNRLSLPGSPNRFSQNHVAIIATTRLSICVSAITRPPFSSRKHMVFGKWSGIGTRS